LPLVISHCKGHNLKILLTIPHFFGPSEEAQEKGKKAGSAGGNVEKRVKVIRYAIRSFVNIFGYQQGIFDIVKRCISPANHRESSDVTVFICTSKNLHLLDQLNNEEIKFNNISSDIDPKYLGFVCHSIMRDFKGQFDYYCYMEDDLIIQDPFFFNKLNWFNQNMGNDYVLQPNRYEIADKSMTEKLYVDGNLPEHWTKPHRDLSLLRDIYLEYLDIKIKFHASLNPHSGCFFLNKEQFDNWSSKPYFLDGDQSLIGPLESAATLGILKCFKPYKASPEHANFFEVLHGDSRYMDRLFSN
jgi:hypothetical protein